MLLEESVFTRGRACWLCLRIRQYLWKTTLTHRCARIASSVQIVLVAASTVRDPLVLAAAGGKHFSRGPEVCSTPSVVGGSIKHTEVGGSGGRETETCFWGQDFCCGVFVAVAQDQCVPVSPVSRDHCRLLCMAHIVWQTLHANRTNFGCVSKYHPSVGFWATKSTTVWAKQKYGLEAHQDVSASGRRLARS